MGTGMLFYISKYHNQTINSEFYSNKNKDDHSPSPMTCMGRTAPHDGRAILSHARMAYGPHLCAAQAMYASAPSAGE